MLGLSKMVDEYSQATNADGRSKFTADVAKAQAAIDELTSATKQLFESELRATELERKIEDRSVNFLDKLKARAEYHKLRNELIQNGILPRKTTGSISLAISQIVGVNEHRLANMANHMGSEKQDFVSAEKQRFADSPYTMEDVADTFTEQNLCELSMEDYIAVLTKYPNELITHVTRQGVRDHTGMMWHTNGLGEVHNGFKGIIENNALVSTIAARTKDSSLEEAICTFASNYQLPSIDNAEWTNKEKTYDERLAELRNAYNDPKNYGKPAAEIIQDFPDLQAYHPTSIHDIKTREEMLYQMHEEQKNPRSADSGGYHFPPLFDKLSVHFAVTNVLDNLYGGETGNECFLVYPQAMVDTNYQHMGVLFQWEPTSQHNDLGVLPKTNAGIPIEAGLIFLPKNAQVDPKTGSKYRLENGKSIGNADDGYALAENPISSQQYWQQYLEDYAKGMNLKVVYYDASLSPTQALISWQRENGILSKRIDYNAEKKRDVKNEEYKQHILNNTQGHSDAIVKEQISAMVDFPELERHINSHFDEFEKDPEARILLQKRKEYMLAETERSPYAQNYDERKQMFSTPLSEDKGTTIS